MRQAKQILQPIEQEKRKKFARKLSELEERRWNRDTFEENVHDVKTTIDTVDELITEVQSDLERLQGSGDQPPRKQEIIDDLGEEYVEQLKEKTLKKGYTLTVAEFAELEQEAKELVQKVNAWKTYQYELAMLAMKELLHIATGYRDDILTRDVADSLEDLTEKVVAPLLKSQRQQLQREMMELLHDHQSNQPATTGPSLSDGDGDDEEMTDTERVDKLLKENPDITNKTIVDTLGVSKGLVSQRRSNLDLNDE